LNIERPTSKLRRSGGECLSQAAEFLAALHRTARWHIGCSRQPCQSLFARADARFQLSNASALQTMTPIIRIPTPVHRHLPSWPRLNFVARVVWAQMEKAAPEKKGPQKITPEMIKQSAAVAGLTFTDEEVGGIVQAVIKLGRYEALREIHIPNEFIAAILFQSAHSGNEGRPHQDAVPCRQRAEVKTARQPRRPGFSLR